MKYNEQLQGIMECGKGAEKGMDSLLCMLKGLLTKGTPAKIILVDDDPFFLKFFDRYCKASGYDRDKIHLVTAHNGDELKAVLKDNGDPILLVDIRLLLEKGVSLVRELNLPDSYKVRFLSDAIPSKEVLKEITDMGATFSRKPAGETEQKALLDDILS